MDSAIAGPYSHQNKLNIIGNNTANANTFGFRVQSYSFREAMYQTPVASIGDTDSTAGSDTAQYKYDTVVGSVVTDMASSIPSYVGGSSATINRQGSFAIRSNKGDITNKGLKSSGRYFTRAGQFSMDNNGYIVGSANNFVFGFLKADPDNPGSDHQTDTLKPLKLTDVRGNIVEGNDEPVITSSAEVNNMRIITTKITDQGEDVKATTIGKIAVALFQSPEGSAKSDGYYYATNKDDNTGSCIALELGSDSAPNLMTGYVEASNVDPTKEFSEPITTQRGFQVNSKIITVNDEILNGLVNMEH